MGSCILRAWPDTALPDKSADQKSLYSWHCFKIYALLSTHSVAQCSWNCWCVARKTNVLPCAWRSRDILLIPHATNHWLYHPMSCVAHYAEKLRLAIFRLSIYQNFISMDKSAMMSIVLDLFLWLSQSSKLQNGAYLSAVRTSRFPKCPLYVDRSCLIYWSPPLHVMCTLLRRETPTCYI